MEKELISILFALLRFEFTGANICESDKSLITEEFLQDLYKFSKKHDVAHLIGDALDKNGLLIEGSASKKYFLNERNMAVYRCEQQEYELECIRKVFEEDKIPFILLKGAVIRRYYPELWMRTSCDIDVLVHLDDLDRAINVLQEKLSYQVQEKTLHDTSLYSESGVHIELHHALMPATQQKKFLSILNNIWEFVLPVGADMVEQKMPNQIFYFYHIAHMVKHFEAGGCGIRPFIDDWILGKNFFLSEEVEQLCNEGGILTFMQKVNELSAIWFEEKKHNQTTYKMQEFVLLGGVYGSMQNSVTVKEIKSKGKKRYILSRIFCPYNILKLQYPVLQKHKWLMPIYQIRRWIEILFCGRSKKALKELRTARQINDEGRNNIQHMLKELDLI